MIANLRRASGLIAAVVLAAFGAALLFSAPLAQDVPALGALLLALGGSAAFWQIRRLLAARRDPYDLSRLWDREPEPPEEADEEAVEDEGTLYCHSCGHAVPRAFHACPECRRPLR
jgi:uncharacterized protein YbaR (Trm112 family)